MRPKTSLPIQKTASAMRLQACQRVWAGMSKRLRATGTRATKTTVIPPHTTLPTDATS